MKRDKKHKPKINTITCFDCGSLNIRMVKKKKVEGGTAYVLRCEDCGGKCSAYAGT